MKGFKILLIFIVAFGIFKAANLGVRLSDTNLYFDVARQLSLGKLLYRDVFFSNFPVSAASSLSYYFLTGKNLLLFFFTPTLEVSAITLFLYLITYKKTKDHLTAFTVSLLYLFSFIVLATSDHQTGVFTASLLAVIGYYFFQEKKFFPAGIFIALSFLTKVYFLPVFLSFYITLLLKKAWRDGIWMALGTSIAGIFVLLPVFMMARREFFADIFGFALTRPAGTVKTEVLWFFLTKDPLLFFLLLFSLFNIRKPFFALLSLFSVLFFFGFRDIYYLYLNFMIPFLCLALPEVFAFFKKTLSLRPLTIPSVVMLFLLLNIWTYVLSYKDLQKVYDFEKIVSLIQHQQPKYLYGVNDITPALISLTNIPAVDNVNDAHVYFFMKGIYDKKKLTKKAVSNRAIIITHGAVYPQANVSEDIFDEIFDKDLIKKSCKKFFSSPVSTEGAANRINLFKCF